jgi:hypothetical protein
MSADDDELFGQAAHFTARAHGVKLFGDVRTRDFELPCPGN